MRIDEDLDHGPILGVARLPVHADEKLPSIADRLAKAGAGAMVDVLGLLAHGPVPEVPQDHSRATHAAKIEKSEGLVTFQESTSAIYNRFRAFEPWPGIFCESDGSVIKIREMRPAEGSGTARTLLSLGEGVVIATADAAVRLIELQKPGKTPVAAAEMARSLGWKVGELVP